MRLPPSDIIEAHSAATPSLPFGSEAAPTLNSKRNVTRGDEFGKSTVGIFAGTFLTAATDSAKMSAIAVTRLLLSILSILLVRQCDDRAVSVDDILACHRF